MKKNIFTQYLICLLVFSMLGGTVIYATPNEMSRDQTAKALPSNTVSAGKSISAEHVDDVVLDAGESSTPIDILSANAAVDTSMTLVTYIYSTAQTTEQLYTLNTTNTFARTGSTAEDGVMISPAYISPSGAQTNSTQMTALLEDLNNGWAQANVNTAPFSFVVELAFMAYDETGTMVVESMGTGFLIAPNVVLTAAHNIYDKQKNYYSTNMYVYTQRVDSSMSGTFQPVTAVFDKRYINNSSEFDYDWALLMLDGDAVAVTGGHFGIGTNSGTLTGKTVCIAGYDNYADPIQFWCQGAITASTGRQIDHNIWTKKGNSGAPIYEPTEYLVVWGIHTNGDETDSSYIPGGTRFTTLMYQFFCERIDFSKDFFGYA